ncbi:amino acid/polyamine transporter I [Chlamydoabsidia padenii]|nr:amino acid/polyamine transporter I [Chlamydoabsidia padenii]
MNGDQVNKEKTTQKNEKPNIAHIEETVEEDQDAQRLKALGYKQEFTRSLGIITQIAFPFTAMAVLPNWLVGFGPSLAAGGPSSLFWGWVVTTPFVICISLSLAEMYSAYPLNGAIYSWTYLLTSKKWGPFMSFISGYIYVAAYIAANMTVAWNLAQLIIGMANVLRGEDISSTGLYVGIYILCTILGNGSMYLGLTFTNFSNYFMVFWLLCGTLIFTISIPVLAPSHQSAEWVFTEFNNTTGYSSSGLVFFLGLLQAGWTMVGYDSGITLSESTKNADRKGPQGIMLCVFFALLQGFALTIAVLFSIQDLEGLLVADLPVSEFFMQVTNQNPHLSAFFLSIMIVAQFGSLANSMVANCRVMWSMARDGCLPYSRFFYKLEKGDVPFRIAVLQGVLMTALILPVFGTMVYWTAVLSAGVICYNFAYGLPLFCRLMWSRDSMPRGPFSLGRWSVPINAIALIWIVFFVIILCFPSVDPVEAETMNYSSLMLGAVFIFAVLYWLYSGHITFKGPIANVEDEDEVDEMES